jgi:hypothetical protein
MRFMALHARERRRMEYGLAHESALLTAIGQGRSVIDPLAVTMSHGDLVVLTARQADLAA